MWFDSGTLYYGDKSVSLNSDNFAGTVKTWAVDKVHIAVSAETAPEVISQLLMSVPFKDVSYSLTLDKDRIAVSAATELYYRNLPQTEGIPFTSAPTQPRFVDGNMEDWVRNRADALYPRECWENGIEGRVMVQFTIGDTKGTYRVLNSRWADFFSTYIDKFLLATSEIIITGGVTMSPVARAEPTVVKSVDIVFGQEIGAHDHVAAHT